MLEVRLLGKFELKSDGKFVAIPSRPAQSLLAFLIMSAGTSHRREKLAGMLWPDSLEEAARSNLRSALWKIRKALPSSVVVEYLFTDDLTVAFNDSAEYWLDAAELAKATEKASANELMTTLSLYYGELLPGFYDEWVVLEREHLSSVFEHHMARLMSSLESEHRWLDILDWGERWIKLGQKPEPAYRALMSAHAAKGDISKVAASYERCVKSLKEFGIEPSEQTRNLYESLKSGKERVETHPTAAVVKKRKSPSKTNLPVPITSFIGREKEVEELVTLVGKNRLVTLAGSGGVGKTRLAIQSSHKLLTKFKDGIWWIDLVGLSDPALVPQAVAKVLDVREIPNQPLADTLVGELQTKQILVVLDNCEHLILACARIADRLLSGTKHLKILATSREALEILGETVWPVPSLSLPDPQDSVTIKSLSKSESVRLFAERANAMQRKFTLTDQNVNAVAQVCRRLSGMPLAIELAAARIKLMSVDEIAKRLDDRFSLLTSGNRSALPRQQTLRATIDWSYDLLTDPDKMLFRRLAVFAGGFTLEAAESIGSDNSMPHSDVLDVLGRLVDKSLVVVDAAADSGQTRYRFLETIREYALEKLRSAGEETAIRDQHLEYFRRLAEETEPHLYASEQAVWFARTDAEIDNLRAALDWSVVEDPGVKNDARIRNGFQLVGVLTWYWRRSYLHDFIERLEHMLSREIGVAPSLERARALYTLGFFYGTQEAAKARPYLEQALDIAQKHNDPLTLSWALTHLAVVTCLLQEYDSSLSLLEESLALTRELGISGKALTGMTLEWMGEDYLGLGDEVRAQELFEESIALLRETNNRDLLSFADRRLGLLMLKQGNYERAEILLKESLQMNHYIGHAPGTAGSLTALAKLALVQGNLTRSAQLYGMVDGRLEVIKAPMLVMDVDEYDNGVTTLRSQLDEKTFENFWMKGRATTLEGAIRFALEEA
ncbi:MAG TPA: tetratricopeptide repeat protein [Anaerolineales bacterium]|nr:tetratricopeptide repeat protein [Anaerolineales bacterium]